MARRGRPTRVTPVAKQEICERIAKGELLLKICEDEHMPSLTAVGRAKLADEEFRAAYARAREDGAEVMVEAGLRMVAHDANDLQETEDGRLITNHEVVARARLHWDAIRWAAGKFNAKRFGDKLDVEHAIPTITHVVDWANAPTDKPDER